MGLPEEKALKIEELRLHCYDIKNDYVTTADGTFFSYQGKLFDWYFEFLTYTNLGALPVGYYINDVNYNRVTMAALGNLQDVIDSITELFYYSNIIEDSHRAVISALTTIPEVQAYDYSIGWPIVPYIFGITFLADYFDTINGISGLGVLNGGAIGGAAIANFTLDLAHDDARYVNYAAAGNADSQQVGTIKFTLIPNYTGAPTADRVLFSICEADGDITNLLQLTHVTGTGQMKVDMYDQADALISGANFDIWSPVADTQYEIIFKYDLTTGATTLHIDGVQIGLTNTAVGVRSAAIGLLRVGGSYDSAAPDNSDFSVRFFSVYNN